MVFVAAFLLANFNNLTLPTSQKAKVEIEADGDDWVASVNGQVLWKKPIDRGRRADTEKYTAISSHDILIVNRAGKIIAELPKTCTYDPKVMVFCGDTFVYTTENWGWRYEKEGTSKSRLHNMNWLSVNKPLRVFDLSKNKLVYHGPLYSVGLPVDGKPGYLTTLYHQNRTRWMKLLDKVPVFELRQVRLSDMKVTQKRRINGTASHLNEVAQYYWSNEEGPDVTFDWSRDRTVEIFGLSFSAVK